MEVTNHKCKKSVFCICFLFFFAVGTICGSLLFSLLLQQQSGWIKLYCTELMLQRTAAPVSFILFFCCPLAAVWSLGLVSFGRKLMFPYTLFRGVVCSYLFAACHTAGLPLMAAVIYHFLQLALFFTVCFHAWNRSGQAEREYFYQKSVIHL